MATCQHFAAAAVADGACNGGVAELSSLGCNGQYSGNIERDYHRWLDAGRKGSRLQTYDVHLTIADLSSEHANATKVSAVPCLLAYEYANKAFELGVFEASFIGPAGPQLVRDFWANAMSQPWGQKHPLAGRDDKWSRSLGILWHFDGVVVNNGSGDKLELGVFSCSSVTASGSTHDTKLPIMVIPTDLIVEETFADIATVVAWQMQCFASGVGPSCGLYGEAFADGSQRARLANQQFAGGWMGHFAGAPPNKHNEHVVLTHAICIEYDLDGSRVVMFIPM